MVDLNTCTAKHYSGDIANRVCDLSRHGRFCLFVDDTHLALKAVFAYYMPMSTRIQSGQKVGIHCEVTLSTLRIICWFF